jgi:GNAT superfamily N-acetyltransferase
VQAFVTRDVADFAEHVGGFLTSRPIEHNVLATVVATLEPTDAAAAPLFGWVEAARTREILGAALRTPPRPLLASSLSAEVADALMAKLLEADPELPGVTGPQPAAASLAEAWRRCTGGTVEPGMRQVIYWLAHVKDPPRRPAGRPRPPGRSDHDLLIAWASAFSRDLGVPATHVESGMARRLRDERLLVWDDDRVVSMVGTRPPVAGVVCLGPVYTPPEARRHGYATALVAEVSRRALAAGATKCMLYTDLANPTSNHIYQAVGYDRSNDAQEYRFSNRA